MVSLLHLFTPSMEMSSTSFTLEITNTIENNLEEKTLYNKKNTKRDLSISFLTNIGETLFFFFFFLSFLVFLFLSTHFLLETLRALKYTYIVHLYNYNNAQTIPSFLVQSLYP
ncbi:hypothetical protein ACMBCN_01740 [Candidatus Liberibacter asiaticus]|nr:hypothetical protein [Candidatus Liberibacter asiaticus]